MLVFCLFFVCVFSSSYNAIRSDPILGSGVFVLDE